MIKQFIGIVCVMAVVGALVGCGLASATQGNRSSVAQGSVGSLSDVNRLVLGTMRLEGTEQAVSAEQAPDLVVLWKAYRSLSASDNTAPAELSALVKQIEAGMTETQLSAITAMQLTPEDLATFVQEKGLFATQSASSTGTSGQAAAQAGPGGPEGGMIGGEMPPDMGGAAMPSAGAAQSASGTGGAQVSTALYDAVITLLSAKG